MSFTHLHCHSHYSLLDGLSKIDPLVERAKELGMDSLAITDHGVMYGTIEFYNKCREEGIKPIIGLEAYVAPNGMEEKNGKVDADYFHLTLLAKDAAGYQNLIRLTTQAHLTGFYYKPRIDLELLKKYSQGLIALSGCMRGEVARAVMNKTEAEAQKVLEKYLEIFGKTNFFIEIQRNNRNKDEKEEILNQKLIKLAKANSLDVVSTADCHYIYPEDSEAQDVMVCIGTGQTVNDADRLDMRGYDLSLKSPERMMELFFDIPEAVTNSQKVADMCNLEIKIDQRYFPRVEVPDGLTTAQYLEKVVYEKGLQMYGKPSARIPLAAEVSEKMTIDGNYSTVLLPGDVKPQGEFSRLEIPPEIKKRIDYELNIIIKKDFDTYFLMVADVVQGAHNIGAITNTRGSAAGSIVGRILGITNVDPLYYELPFERFLTMHRPTPPDIDLDVADNRRDEVIQYITQKYGADKVAQIITFGTMKARAAVRDVGRALAVPYSKCDQIAKMIPIGKQGFDMSLDIALDKTPELKEIYSHDPETRRILDIAKKMEGCARHASMHAAGIVITPTALTDYMPLQKEPDGERIITEYDMYALDVNANSKAIGVVKLDLLGIRNLSILEAAVGLVERRHHIKIDLENLPHPDPRTFKLLSEGYTFGVFQLGSSGITRYMRELKPQSIFDIMAMIALYRPGPMAIIPEYIERLHDPAKIRYFDPRMKDFLSRSLGLLVYQDDILLTVIHIAGYSWEEADKFRKAMGKKIPAEMAKQKVKFVDGCVKNGMKHARAEELFALIEPFAAYGFGKAHAASYSSVSYQTAYMKANYTVEFMAALMTAESGDEDKIYEAVEDCAHLGIKVLPPDVNESLGDFTVVDEHTIRFGLNAIKNLGSDVIGKIIEVRKIGESEKSENQSSAVSQSDSPILRFSDSQSANPTDQQKFGHVFNSIEDFLTRTYTKNLNKRSWEALAKVGALDRFGERGQLVNNTEEILEFIRENFKNQNSGQHSLFGKSLQMGKLRLRESVPATMEEKLMWEKELLGMYVSAHPLDKHRNVLSAMRSFKSLSLEELGGKVVMGGIITRLKKTVTRKNDPMAFFTLEDLTGNIEVLVFPKVMEKVIPFLNDDTIVQVSGKLSDKDEEFKLIADDIKLLPSDDLYGMALTEMGKNKQVILHMDSLSNMAALNKIKEILEVNKGNVQVYLSVGTGPNAKKIKTQSQIMISNEMLAQLRAIDEVVMIDVI